MLTRSIRSMSVLVTAFVLAACGGSSGTTTGDGGTETGEGGTCATGATGTVSINVTGLPAGVNAKVTVTGPSGTTSVSATQSITDAASGSYAVTAEVVTKADPIVRTAYAPAVSTSSFCLESGQTQTVDVTYKEIATSHRLWVTNSNNPSGQLLAFPSASLGATGAPSASPAVKAPAGRALAFDKDGNLWALGATTVDAPLARFAAADLASAGQKMPDRKIDVDVGGCAPPGLSNMAFDKDGALWLASACANKVMKLTKEQLGASGKPAPSVVISNTADPLGIAFDAAGNLWITDTGAGTLLRYDASRLAASTSDAADLVLTPRAANNAQLKPSHIAFDAGGNLWAINFGGNSVYKLTPAELAGTGAKDVVPSIEVTVTVSAILASMAFDESGGLWLTYSQGKIARLAPAQLGASSGPGNPTTPETILSSPDIGSAHAMAFFPAAAGLPLYASLK
jgi:sugar lactone lactonase YvrE